MKEYPDKPQHSTTIPIASIRLDGGTQPRAGLYHDAVEEYSIDVAAGATYPPVDVFHDGQDHWLAHGFHRVHAHVKAGRDAIDAVIHQGTQDDAKWFSYSANHEQDRVGLRRTNADKARAVRAALAHPQGLKMGDAAIAAHVGVSDEMVRKHRKAISQPLEDAPATRTVTRGGKSYTMNVGKIGKSKVSLADDASDKRSAPIEMEEGVVEDADPATITDSVGKVITDVTITAAFANRHLFKSFMHEISSLKSKYKELGTLPGGEYIQRLSGQQQTFEADVSNLHAAIRFIMPYAVCPYCGGGKCVQCKRTGWMPEDVYKRVPAEIRGGAENAA